MAGMLMNETLYECPKCGFIITQEEFNDHMSSPYDWDCSICKMEKISDYVEIKYTQEVNK